MIHTNVQRFDSLPFKDYLFLPGYSHSFLKREVNGVVEDTPVTGKMHLGSLVDAILTDPFSANMKSPLYPAAKDISRKIRSDFGDLIKSVKKQVSFTGAIRAQDFLMDTKGRLDYLLENIAVIDLKVTDTSDINALIAFMGYRNQLWNYAKLAGVKDSFLLIYSLKLKTTLVKRVDCRDSHNEFWHEKVLKFGRVAA